MSTETTMAVKAARKAVYDKIESQIHTFEAQVATMRARAESSKADAELAALADLAKARLTLDAEIAKLKNAGEAAFERVKADVEGRIAEFARSLRAIESRIKG